MAKRRKNGAGTVRKRADGRWEGRVVVDHDEQGRAKTKNVLAKTKAECIAKLEALQAACLPAVTKCTPDMAFGAWLDFWYQTFSKPKLRLNTQLGYEERIYKHIIPAIGGIPLNKLTQNDLQQFYTKLKTSGRLIRVGHFGPGLSDRMVRVCRATCRSALQKAVEEGLIRTNPAIGCKLPPKKSGEMNILTQEEMQRFLIQAKQDGYYELFLLELGTGLRLGEILALQWEDLDMETGELQINKSVSFIKGQPHITEPKTKASIRKLILPGALLEVLKAYKGTINSRWMFPSPVKEDCPLTPNYARRRMQQTLERAQCKKVRFHDLRHTMASMLYFKGVDSVSIFKRLGHLYPLLHAVAENFTGYPNAEAAGYRICLQMFLQAVHDLRIGFLYAAKIPAEPILIQLFTGFAVPQAAGIGADLISQDNGPIGQPAKLQLKIHQCYAAGSPECLQQLVDAKSVVFDGLNLLPGSNLQRQGMAGVQQGIGQCIVLIGKFNGRLVEHR